jgi:hypothetical protein
MEENSYAANGVKHCIRPQDMAGKSSAIILRQMHPAVVKEALDYDQKIDLPMWLSTLSLSDQQVDFHEQKRKEALSVMNQPKAKKEDPEPPDGRVKPVFLIERVSNWN